MVQSTRLAATTCCIGFRTGLFRRHWFHHDCDCLSVRLAFVSLILFLLLSVIPIGTVVDTHIPQLRMKRGNHILLLTLLPLCGC